MHEDTVFMNGAAVNGELTCDIKGRNSLTHSDRDSKMCSLHAILIQQGQDVSME